MNITCRRRIATAVANTTIAGAMLLASCSSTASKPTTTTNIGAAVLPAETNPILNNSTADGLTIDSVLVENNVDSETGKTADDHLEMALSNTSTTTLTNIEIFYTFTNPRSGLTESYFTKLPSTFSIPPGGTRIAHFDDSGRPDHFAVNKFSLYYTDIEQLNVTVTVSAPNFKIQTTDLTKDAGGAEAAD